MKKNIKTLSIYLTVGLMALTGVGCNPWLDDLKPDNKQMSDDFWQNKEEVDAVVQSMYVGMRECMDKIFLWGELRADMLGLGTASANISDVRSMIIDPSNTTIVSWQTMYVVIGRANSILDYADGVLERDITFAQSLLNAYKGEAKFMRALSYFYLVRTFGDIPYVTTAYVSDRASFRIPKSSKEEVMAGILDDLMGERIDNTSGLGAADWYVDRDDVTRRTNGAIHWCKPSYGTWDLNKGRPTRVAAYTLLADVALWDERYQLTLSAIDQAYQLMNLATGQFELVRQNQWFQIFATGNSSESIFELQWRNGGIRYYTNTFISNNLRNTSLAYKASSTAMGMFTSEDTRGITASFLNDGTIWKFAGNETSISKTENNRTQFDNGWIFYRIPDLFFMEIEALAMLETNYSSIEFQNAWNRTINTIRMRAGFTIPTTPPSTRSEVLLAILDEKAREFFVEGKRWFDIHRLAKKDQYDRKDYLIEILLAEVSARERPIFLAKLQDPNGYYLPIPQRDIDNSGSEGVDANGKPIFVLVQNPFYE